jgi:hypothetical protein
VFDARAERRSVVVGGTPIWPVERVVASRRLRLTRRRFAAVWFARQGEFDVCIVVFVVFVVFMESGRDALGSVRCTG